MPEPYHVNTALWNSVDKCEDQKKEIGQLRSENNNLDLENSMLRAEVDFYQAKNCVYDKF